MERYLGKQETTDLLTLMKINAAPKQNQKSSAAEEWKAFESGHVRSIDVVCDIQEKNLKTKNYVGWKTDENGNRVYTTFRAGQRVHAQGQEAFKLAHGDGNIKKRKATEIVELDSTKENETKKNSKRPSKQPTISSEVNIASFFKKS